MTKSPDEFSAEERALLDSWSAGEPPPGFAQRVLALDETRRRSGGQRTIAAALAIAASVAAVVWSAGSTPVHGVHRATERSTLALGSRAIAVAEAGTELEWTIDRRGRAEIDQRSGDTFYRVERGAQFVVHTPRGDVRVVGTCFRVEVPQMISAASSGLLGAGVGAVVAAAVVVTVYEGKVSATSADGEVAIAAGESARLDGVRAPSKLGARGERSASSPSAGSSFREQELSPNAPAEEVLAAHRALKVEAEQMRDELESLRAEIERAKNSPRDRKMYDLPQEELLRMAEKCELRWDSQGLHPESQTIRTEDLEKLHLSEEERAVIDRVYKEDHARVLKAVTALYVEITGDSSPGALAPASMFEEISDKAPKGELQRVFQTLARERAGLQPPRADPSLGSPWERAFRLMTASGDELQGAFAKELGAETAKALRDLHGGWGSRSGLSAGCPDHEQ